MLDIKNLIKEIIYLRDLNLKKKLRPREDYLGSDIVSRVSEDGVMIYYLDSSDQIWIPCSYLNLFQELQRTDGGRIRENQEEMEFISLGLNLPEIILNGTDPRGIRNILSRMVILGTSSLRSIIPNLEPWVLCNVKDSIEI